MALYLRTLGVGGVEGFADDYAYLIRGLLDLYETGYDQQWLEWSVSLQDKQNELFWDERKGGYFNSTSSDPSILLRMKEGRRVWEGRVRGVWEGRVRGDGKGSVGW